MEENGGGGEKNLWGGGEVSEKKLIFAPQNSERVMSR